MSGTYVIAVFSLLGVAAFVRLRFKLKYVPKPYKIDLPDFKGQILPANEVHSKAFCIEREFKEVSSWGEDSILTFGVCSNGEGGEVELKAWRPHETISGVFEFARKAFTSPDKYCIRHVAKVHREGGVLEVIAEYQGGSIAFFVFQLILLAFVFLCIMNDIYGH